MKRVDFTWHSQDGGFFFYLVFPSGGKDSGTCGWLVEVS